MIYYFNFNYFDFVFLYPTTVITEEKEEKKNNCFFSFVISFLFFCYIQ